MTTVTRQSRTVIYKAGGNKSAVAQVTFDENACKVAGINLEEYEIEKLMVNPNPSKESWDWGWSEFPEIQFTSGRIINQNYSCSQGKFKLFEYQIIK